MALSLPALLYHSPVCPTDRPDTSYSTDLSIAMQKLQAVTKSLTIRSNAILSSYDTAGGHLVGGLANVQRYVGWTVLWTPSMDTCAPSELFSIWLPSGPCDRCKPPGPSACWLPLPAYERGDLFAASACCSSSSSDMVPAEPHLELSLTSVARASRRQCWIYCQTYASQLPGLALERQQTVSSMEPMQPRWEYL